MFREFLRCEYSEENILFWLACEDLKKENNPEKIEEKARMIYEDYVSILSPREVMRYLKFKIIFWKRTFIFREINSIVLHHKSCLMTSTKIKLNFDVRWAWTHEYERL